MNKFMFNIGVFPISMTGSLSLFVNVKDLRFIVNRTKIACNIICGTGFHVGEQRNLKLDEDTGRWVNVPSLTHPEGRSNGGCNQNIGGGGGTGWNAYTLSQKLMLGFIAAYFAVHITAGLRVVFCNTSPLLCFSTHFFSLITPKLPFFCFITSVRNFPTIETPALPFIPRCVVCTRPRQSE